MTVSFKWSDAFLTGIEEVDSQHYRLVDLINQYGDLIANNDVDTEVIDTLYKKLVEYTQYHFKEEEEIMSSYHLDHRHLSSHKEAHRQFLNEISTIYSNVSNQDVGSATSLLSLLIHWLAFHILGKDVEMSKQIEAIRQGATHEQAYQKYGRMMENNPEPLVEALNGLFEQVSMRNKELRHLNENLELKVAQRTEELKIANKKLEAISLTDALTQLPNRRYAMKGLQALWEESQLEGIPLACMMIDADHFKQVNDTYGHDCGDKVLIELAHTLSDSLRTDDMVCRLGGDEFVVICPNTDLDDAVKVAETMRVKISELKVEFDGGDWHGSVSIGVAARRHDMEGFEALIKVADQGVYQAKRAGKNCCRSVQWLRHVVN
jgi:hemerythrin